MERGPPSIVSFMHDGSSSGTAVACMRVNAKGKRTVRRAWSCKSVYAYICVWMIRVIYKKELNIVQIESMRMG